VENHKFYSNVTVDGRYPIYPANHLGCIFDIFVPRKEWDKLPTSTGGCGIASINKVGGWNFGLGNTYLGNFGIDVMYIIDFLVPEIYYDIQIAMMYS